MNHSHSVDYKEPHLQPSPPDTLPGLTRDLSNEPKHRFLTFRAKLLRDEKRKRKPAVDRKAHSLVSQLGAQLYNQREMIKHLDVYGAPINKNDAYFERKMKNFFEEQKMENSVNNYEIDSILSGGGLHMLKQKKPQKVK